MTEPSTPIQAEDEIDLLDLLVTIAESWKLLLFVPLLVGAMTATIATFFPPTYQSSAIVRLAEEEVAVLHSAAVLDPLLEPFAYSQKAQGILEDARQALKQDLSYSTDKRTKLVTISAKAASPEQAQQLNTQAIARLLDELTPKGQEKANIEALMAIRQQAADVAEQSLAQFRDTSAAPPTSPAQAAENTGHLIQLVMENKQEVQALKARLLPKGAELFVQPPTLPQKPLPRKVALISLLVVLASGFALLLFVFIRSALKAASNNPESAAKLARIHQALRLKARP